MRLILNVACASADVRVVMGSMRDCIHNVYNASCILLLHLFKDQPSPPIRSPHRLLARSLQYQMYGRAFASPWYGRRPLLECRGSASNKCTCALNKPASLCRSHEGMRRVQPGVTIIHAQDDNILILNELIVSKIYIRSLPSSIPAVITYDTICLPHQRIQSPSSVCVNCYPRLD